MARTVSNNAVLEVTAVQEMNSQTVLNVFHYRLAASAAIDGDAATTILDNTAFGGIGSIPQLMKVLNTNTWSYVHTKYQWISPVRYTPLTSNDEAGAGLSASEPLPQNVAVVLTKRAAIAGRQGIGSVHLAGLTVDDQLAGSVHADRIINMLDIGAVATQVIDIGAVLAGATLTPLVSGRLTLPSAPRWEDYTPQPTIRVMRRRTVGLGI